MHEVKDVLKTNLLATKFHRPAIPARWIQRPHLSQRLNEGLELNRRVTLVSAPAGFGKTSAISEWIGALDRPVSWLSLDPADNDPGRFFLYFIAALQKVAPHIGREVAGVVQAGQLPPAEVTSTTLINDILEVERRFLLVLDDFQVIQDAYILQVLEHLVTNLPQPLHLVLVTREDPPLPLARLRANNGLTEIRARDLRFTGQDADRFLNELMSLSLSAGDIAILADKTEGWIAGLQLAALAMQSSRSAREQTEPSNFIATLGGSHRFILSYLTEQVLSQQTEEIRMFLLQTSILDKLNSDLCDTVTGRSDSRALLEGLLGANLFLTPLDEEGRWYRYHHLFADLLRDMQTELQPDHIAALHQRASQWYVQAGGEGGVFLSEAIQHALAAGDYDRAANLLESHAMEMIMQGYAQTVNGWVQAIPQEWRSQSARTSLAFAWMHLLRGDYAQASTYLEQLPGVLASFQGSDEEKHALEADWLVIQSLFRNKEGKLEASRTLVEKALATVPATERRVRSMAYFSLATAYQGLNEHDLAVDAYRKALQYGHGRENSIAVMLSTSSLAQLAFEHGQLHLAVEIAAPVSARLEESGSLPPISTVVFGILGEVYYQWYQLEPARRNFLRALQLSTLGGFKSGIINCWVLLARLSQLAGDQETAAREIQTALDLLQVDTPDYVRQEVVAQQVRVYLAQNRPAAAEMALHGQGFSFRDRFAYPDPASGLQAIPYSSGLLYNSSLHYLLYQARTRQNLAYLEAGRALADQLVRRAQRSKYIPILVETLLLRAQISTTLGDQRASQADVLQALELAEPEGFSGGFLEHGLPVGKALAGLLERNQLGNALRTYGERLLALFPGSPEPGPGDSLPATASQPAEHREAAPVEPLTDRELEVLRLMADGLKYQEIASRLYISLNTVRTHAKAIYGKLNVNNRTRAIEKARQIQILEG